MRARGWGRLYVAGTIVLMAAARSAPRQSQIPIRSVAVLTTSDSGVVSSVYAVHARSDGSVLLDDAVRHRLLLFDSALKRYRVLADTAHESASTFGLGPGGLLPFPGDSTAFVDRMSQTLVIVGGHGNLGRTIALPRPSDSPTLSGSTNGVPGFAKDGRLYYKGTLLTTRMGQPEAGDPALQWPDSAPIVRADLDSRRIDTIALVRIPQQRVRVRFIERKLLATTILNPVPVTDEWAYFPDGTVAIVRGHDYHIDWYFPTGSQRSTPRMPFDWRRIDERDKHRIVDSVQHLLDSAYDAAVARAAMTGGRGTPNAMGPQQKGEVVRPDELPDYYPAVRVSGQMRVDPDNHLWILPTTSRQASGGLVYDIVNRDGQVMERVRLPEGRVLQGFGPGGTLYMSVPAVFGWARIERARIERP